MLVVEVFDQKVKGNVFFPV